MRARDGVPRRGRPIRRDPAGHGPGGGQADRGRSARVPADGGRSGRDGIDPRIRQRRVAVARSAGRQRLRLGLAALAVAVVVGAALAVLHSPVLSARHVVVEGPHSRTPAAAIIAAAGLAHDPPLIDIDAGRASASVTSLPWVAAAKVAVDWPDSVVVTVDQRTPVAAVAGPGGTWSEVDRSGRTLEVVSARPAGIVALAVHAPGGVAGPGPGGIGRGHG